ncbi:hypothetical protein SLOPH_794 [Spraguea lophii 42_110]|uniref:Uncharacterized protein n=1 Tax=Spraguea lophii (strain 42_110) TaxID=1358809 RepID=S7W951_SPRLO|nr:hypothetical protein SLOPH_794 [Spraguea lophii 42_110]
MLSFILLIYLFIIKIYYYSIEGINHYKSMKYTYYQRLVNKMKSMYQIYVGLLNTLIKEDVDIMFNRLLKIIINYLILSNIMLKLCVVNCADLELHAVSSIYNNNIIFISKMSVKDTGEINLILDGVPIIMNILDPLDLDMSEDEKDTVLSEYKIPSFKKFRLPFYPFNPDKISAEINNNTPPLEIINCISYNFKHYRKRIKHNLSSMFYGIQSEAGLNIAPDNPKNIRLADFYKLFFHCRDKKKKLSVYWILKKYSVQFIFFLKKINEIEIIINTLKLEKEVTLNYLQNKISVKHRSHYESVIIESFFYKLCEMYISITHEIYETEFGNILDRASFDVLEAYKTTLLIRIQSLLLKSEFKENNLYCSEGYLELTKHLNVRTLKDFFIMSQCPVSYLKSVITLFNREHWMSDDIVRLLIEKCEHIKTLLRLENRDETLLYDMNYLNRIFSTKISLETLYDCWM